jgi:5-methylcytosine-specific restriction endonuclease McrA
MQIVQTKPERQALMMHLRKLCGAAGIPPNKTIAGLVTYLAGKPMSHAQALDWLAADMAANPPRLRPDPKPPKPEVYAKPQPYKPKRKNKPKLSREERAARSRAGHERKLARDAAFIARAEARMLKQRGEKPAAPKKSSKQRKWTFYKSAPWLALRAKVYEKYHGKCCLCGRSHRHDGVKIHADHIKPRSKYPHLELVEDNIQLLCEDCNLGKSNRYTTDWRSSSDQPSPAPQESAHSPQAAPAVARPASA